MRLYLSSYKIGNKSEELKSMLQGLSKVVFYIANAIDYVENAQDVSRRREETFTEFQNRGYEVRELDLKKYFGKQDILMQEIKSCGLLWIRGGNTFVLRQAMFLSGLDNIILNMRENNYPLVYGGYSAGCCVLSKDIKGLEIVDQPEIQCYGNSIPTMREGVGLLNYLLLPHYKSNHPESTLIDQTVDYCINQSIPYKTLSDGEVIII